MAFSRFPVLLRRNSDCIAKNPRKMQRIGKAHLLGHFFHAQIAAGQQALALENTHGLQVFHRRHPHLALKNPFKMVDAEPGFRGHALQRNPRVAIIGMQKPDGLLGALRKNRRSGAIAGIHLLQYNGKKLQKGMLGNSAGLHD